MKLQKIIIICVFCIALQPANAQTKTITNLQDKKSIDSCVQKFYGLICFNNNKLDKIDSVISMFTPGGRLIATFTSPPTTWNVSQFINFIKEGSTKQRMSDRFETELFEKTDIFGNIAHRLSTYQINATINGKPDQRKGVNSIQLIKQEGKWLVSSLVWDRESDGLKIPASYLKNAN